MIALYGKRDILPWQNKEEYYEKYSDMSKEELLTLKAQLDKEYADIKAKGLASICHVENRQQTSSISRWD